MPQFKSSLQCYGNETRLVDCAQDADAMLGAPWSSIQPYLTNGEYDPTQQWNGNPCGTVGVICSRAGGAYVVPACGRGRADLAYLC